MRIINLLTFNIDNWCSFKSGKDYSSNKRSALGKKMIQRNKNNINFINSLINLLKKLSNWTTIYSSWNKCKEVTQEIAIFSLFENLLTIFQNKTNENCDN